MLSDLRFIPNREGQDLHSSFNLIDESVPDTPSKSKRRAANGELHYQKSWRFLIIDASVSNISIAAQADRTFSNLLRSELFETSIPMGMRRGSNNTIGANSTTPPSNSPAMIQSGGKAPGTPHKNLFSYMSPRHLHLPGHPTPHVTPRSMRGINLDTTSDLYATTPIRYASRQLLLTPRRQPRTVSKVPFKVLDAPDLADDFYLNLVDWGSSNLLGVGLGSCVYMWNAVTQRVTKLAELADDQVTSVSWIQRGSHVAIGTNKGLVQIWDAEKCRRLRTMTGHTNRAGALAWNDHILTSGSRDRNIFHRDVRSSDQYIRKLVGHKQEICGLKWNTEDGQLASGGNDNKLMVWDKLNDNPLFKFADHSAAVKAIAWSPHQHNLLASGGGTADRSIKFWNTSTGSLIQDIDTGSQVCNLAWSKNSNEIVSTHGYSQNQIVLWKYPSMTQVASLTGHTFRVLYLAMSPDGQTVVTGAGDETLRFWKCFGRRDRDSVSGDGSSAMEAWDNIR